MAAEDKRSSTRKPLRVRGNATMIGGTSLTIRTLDVSMAGVCACMPKQLSTGYRCLLHWTMLVHGRPREVSIVAQVVYSVLGGCDNQGFKTGLRFVEVNGPDIVTLRAYLD